MLFRSSDETCAEWQPPGDIPPPSSPPEWPQTEPDQPVPGPSEVPPDAPEVPPSAPPEE